ncbi:MAG: hypothetical protein Fur0043_07860 [Anaerolineales bacterium]
MKKLLFFLLVLGLTACSAVPTQPPAPQPTPVPPTPQVVIVTVEVPVQPTQAPPSPIPTVTPLPPPTEIPTQPVEPTQPAAAAPTSAQPTASGPISIPAEFNGPVFANITVSTNTFSLRCAPKEISFDLYATDIYITRVDFYYRIRDKHSNDIPEWSLGGTLETDGGNHFWLTYSGESVKPDNRKDFGWFDLQFVGMNKLGQVVGRTEKIVDLISYTIDCP